MQFKYKNILIICLLSLFTIPVFSQQTFNMGGVVSDAEGALPGVSIHLKGRTVGTTTDLSGAFRIRALQGDIIVFTYLGYETIEFYVEREVNDMQLIMVPAAGQIEEMVVTALGSQRRISVVGAITTVDVAELQSPATSISNMLGGRVAGMITTLDSGEPGRNISEFWVRGIGTFGASNSALVLIDGLEGDLRSLDPADIESFSVLKDASATAVYGVRGANGVVLITTKRGHSGRLRVTARANYTVSHLNRLPKYVRSYDYALLANEAKAARGEEAIYDANAMRIIRDGLDLDLFPDVDWQKEIIRRTSFQQTYYMSAQGGADVARYFVSLGTSIEDAAYNVSEQNTIRGGVGFNTYNYRMNLDVNLTKNTSLYFGTDGFMSLRKQPGWTNTDDLWNTQSMLTPITVPIRYSTGELPAYSDAFGGSGISPYVLMNYTGTTTVQHYTGTHTIALVHDFSDFVDNLKLRLQGAYDNNSWLEERRYQMPELYLASMRDMWGQLARAVTVDRVSPTYTYTQRQSRKFELQGTLTWEKVVATDHRVGGLLYYYMSDSKDTRSTDLATFGRRAIESLPRRYQGISSRLTYGFRDTYMIDFNFGYTGSENFEPGKRFGFFPSVALGWVPTQYNWAKENASWLSFLKLRASYGTVGSDVIAGHRFPFMTLIDEVYPQGWGGGGSSALFSNEGIREIQFGANNLVWEVAVKANVGIEARMFDDKLSFVIDFFNDTRNDIFQRRETIPGHVGLTFNARPYGNVGSMRSYGTDGNVAYQQEINSDWSFTVRANYTYAQNEIINWEQQPERFPYRLLNGYPVNATRGYIAVGLFTDERDVANSPTQTFSSDFPTLPGDIKYKDVNGDGVINADDMVFLSDPSFPRLMYGFGGELRYRNFTFGVLFRGTGKIDMFHVGYEHPGTGWGRNGPGYVPFNNGELGNVMTMVADPANRWIPREYARDNGIPEHLAENPNARFPRLSYGYNANNSQLSTFWKNDARYLRLQEITLNYNYRGDFLSRVGMQSVDIQFVANNVYVWDKIKEWDPEQGYRNGRAYPIPSRYALQFYLNF